LEIENSSRALLACADESFVVVLHRYASNGWTTRWQSRGFSRGNQLAAVRRKRLRASATHPFQQTSPSLLLCLLLEVAPLLAEKIDW